MGNNTLSNRFLEINGVYPKKTIPAKAVSNHFLRINDAYTSLSQTASTVLANSLEAAQAPLNPRENPEDIQRLAERYAPILVLSDRAYNLPGDPIDFIDASKLRRDNPLTLKFWQKGDDTIADNTDENGQNNFTSADIANPSENDLYLDLDNDRRADLGRAPDDSRGPAPLHYQFNAGAQPPTITYFVFYPYNDGPTRQNHEGDWERVTLELDQETFEPSNAILSAHTHSNQVPIQDITDQNTGRPVIYVAHGSHANYSEAGSFSTEFPGLNDNTVSHAIGIPLSEIDGAVIYSQWGNVKDVTEQKWYSTEAGNNGVRWGEIGEFSWSSGPHGPSAEKGAVPPPEE